MSLINVSQNNLMRALCLAGWCVLFYAGALAMTGAPEKPNLTAPLQKCWVYGTGNGLSRAIASDNENNLVVAVDNFSLISFNSQTKIENWKTQTGGRIDSETVSDDKYLFFLTTVEDVKKGKNYSLNSISLTTGTTNWQKRFEEKLVLRLVQIPHEELIFYLVGDKRIQAIKKTDGSLRWEMTFPLSIAAVKRQTPDQMGIYLDDRVFMTSLSTGETLKEIKLPKKLNGGFQISESVSESQILLGNSSGELLKILPSENKSDILWRIKTGGGITGLFGVENDVLVTSLDNFIYLIATTNGKIKWKKRVSGRINLKPLIFDNLAVVVSSGDNIATVIDLDEGRAINRIQIEEDNYFSGPPLVADRFLIFQTFRGVYFFGNSGEGCR